MTMLKSASILILFISVISVSAQFDNPLMKYLTEHYDGCSADDIKKAATEFMTCTVDMQNQMKAMPRPVNRNYDRDAKQICTFDFSKCLSKMGKVLQKCMSPAMYKEYFTNPVKIIVGAQKYACANDGKPLQDLLDNGIPCFTEAKESVMGCNQMISEFGHKYSEKEFLLKESCDDLDKIGACFVHSLDTCKDKTATNFVRGILQSSLEETDCRDISLVKVPDSSTSLSAFNFLLVVAGMFALLVNS